MNARVYDQVDKSLVLGSCQKATPEEMWKHAVDQYRLYHRFPRLGAVLPPTSHSHINESVIPRDHGPVAPLDHPLLGICLVFISWLAVLLLELILYIYFRCGFDTLVSRQWLYIYGWCLIYIYIYTYICIFRFVRTLAQIIRYAYLSLLWPNRINIAFCKNNLY